jgi:hypothetical protein
MTSPMSSESANGPTKAGWVCLIASWFFMLLPIPVVSWLGAFVLGFACFVVAIATISKGYTGAGILQLLILTFGSPIVYFIGIGIMGASFSK